MSRRSSVFGSAGVGARDRRAESCEAGPDPRVHARLPLADAARAHEMLEGGEVLGKLLLVP